MKASDVKTAKTADLIAFYNLHADRKVKKFQDRATAEKRVLEVIEWLPSDADFVQNRDLAKIIPPSPDAVRTDKPTRRRNSDFADAADEFRKEMIKAGADVEQKRTERDQCPKCFTTADQTPAGLEGETAADRNFCHHCDTEYWPETGKIYNAPKKSAGRSAAIAESWGNADVAARRAQRMAVKVFSKDKLVGEYKSTAAAFRALALPFAKHIQFRGTLRQDKKATISVYHFEVAA